MTVRVVLSGLLSKPLDYLVPSHLVAGIALGAAVSVPFRSATGEGFVVAINPADSVTGLLPIREVRANSAAINGGLLKLATWMAGYYRTSLPLVFRALFPGAVRKSGARHQTDRIVSLCTPCAVGKLSAKQERIVALLEERGPMAVSELVVAVPTTRQTVQRMVAQRILVESSVRRDRDPHANEPVVGTRPLELNSEQGQVFHQIQLALRRPPATGEVGSGEPKPFLLHGITGSGKTEIYLQAMSEALAMGGGAIVLVPEISLTPQTVERFRARVSAVSPSEKVAVLHSNLSDGERHDEWHAIREGRARIVIGARSAVFAPVRDLRLIVVDEEHEHSYKQEESPRYHARDVAVMRGKLEGCVVVLGSATPSLESYRNAQLGRYQLLELTRRATEFCLPIVRVVDMRMQSRAKRSGGGIISQPLREAILSRLEKREQTILFLNRRGYATSLICERCGRVEECPNCSVALTFHRAADQLLCHICGHAAKTPAQCLNPECGNPAIRFSGLGTERVEEVLGLAFPKAVVRRMDSDTLRRKNEFREILAAFRVGKIDILLGTQMIAKGLDFPNVTLVGIINSDLGLHLPDFRAGERTFQLLTQVAGRAGRGDVEGEVVVQSFTPFHPAIQFARRHDFQGFYEQEIEFRRQLEYPPFARIALVTLKGRNEEKVRFCADKVAHELAKRVGELPVRLSGPAPAPLTRAETFYRFQIMLRTPHMTKLTAKLARFEEEFPLPEGVDLAMDVDPVNLQ